MLARANQVIQEQNVLLQQEIYERQQVEQALRAEQEKSERLLLNILPEPIAWGLMQNQNVNRPAGSQIAEQFDEVTILFADIERCLKDGISRGTKGYSSHWNYLRAFKG